MDGTYPTKTNTQKWAPRHILVDEEYLEEVEKVSKSPKFPARKTATQPEMAALEDVKFDDPDKAGLVAMCWSGDQEATSVVDRIRAVDPSLYDMVAPDHTK